MSIYDRVQQAGWISGISPDRTKTNLLVINDDGSINTALSETALSQGIPGSGTITVGGQAQFIFSNTIPANGYYLFNPNDTVDIWFSDSGVAAPNAAGSQILPALGGYETPAGYRPIARISLYSSLTGHAFTAARW
jgi:hypothetical protein